MKDSNRKIIYMLWTVIVVLIIGFAIGGFMLARKTDDLSQTNSELTGNNLSLREQLRQAKATPAPTKEAIPTIAPTAVATPSPTATPKTSATPKP